LALRADPPEDTRGDREQSDQRAEDDRDSTHPLLHPTPPTALYGIRVRPVERKRAAKAVTRKVVREPTNRRGPS
jgi:hypothetical protein